MCRNFVYLGCSSDSLSELIFQSAFVRDIRHLGHCGSAPICGQINVCWTMCLLSNLSMFSMSSPYFSFRFSELHSEPSLCAISSLDFFFFRIASDPCVSWQHRSAACIKMYRKTPKKQLTKFCFILALSDYFAFSHRNFIPYSFVIYHK